jgi:hypothetical protein
MTAAKFARGVHGAEHGANKVLPPERYAQAITGGAAPPGIAQGDTAPPADASGTPIPTSDGGSVTPSTLRLITPNLPPGAHLGRDRKTGKLIVQEGNFNVYDSNKNWIGMVPVPKAQERQAPAGYRFAPDGSSLQVIPGGPADKPQGTDAFSGTGMENQARNALVRGARDPAFTSTPEYAAARSYLLKPRFDPQTQTMIPPEDLSQFPPATYSARGQIAPAPQQPNAAPPQVGQPGAPPMPTPPGGIVATPVPGLPQKPMTEGQANAALYADRMREADAIIAANEKAGMSVGGKALEILPGGVGNFLQSDSYQLFEQARRNFINAVLRRESGAVIADTEFANAEKQYFPRPGDSEAVLNQKAANRRSAIDGISRAAGETYKPQGAAQQAPAAGPAAAPPQAPQGADRGKLLFDARDAISKGADPAKVRERLRAMGVEGEL